MQGEERLTLKNMPMDVTELEEHGVHGASLALGLGHDARSEEATGLPAFVNVQLGRERVEGVAVIQEALVRVGPLVAPIEGLHHGVRELERLAPDHVRSLPAHARPEGARVHEARGREVRAVPARLRGTSHSHLRWHSGTRRQRACHEEVIVHAELVTYPNRCRYDELGVLRGGGCCGALVRASYAEDAVLEDGLL